MKKARFVIPILIAAAVMAMALTDVRNARLTSRLTISENLNTPTTSAFIEINGLDEVVNYTPGSTRFDADNVYAKTVTGDGTLDLTSLTNTLGEALDLTGEVIVAAKFLLPDSAGASCVLAQGGSNPYPLFGDTWSVTLQANQSLLYKADTVLIPVSASAKTISYNSSGTTVPLYIILLTADSYQ